MLSQRRCARGLAPHLPSNLRRCDFDLHAGRAARWRALDRTVVRPWDGRHPTPTMAWAPTPTRWKLPSKIYRTKNPQGPRILVGCTEAVMLALRSS